MRELKACPVIIRHRATLELLVFRHPLAGIQLVKGSIERMESPLHACQRELREESGVEAQACLNLGEFFPKSAAQQWHIYLMSVNGTLPDSWSFYTDDDGGLLFEFFWYPLDAKPGSDWLPLFQEAFAYISDALGKQVGAQLQNCIN